MDFPYAYSGTGFAGTTRLTNQPFALIGVPFDGAVTNRSGARHGPQAIRLASQMLCDATHPLFATTPRKLLGDAGNMALPNASGLVAARQQIANCAKQLFANHHPVFLGGDHSITLALLQAAAAQHGQLALVHFDAHCDTWDSHFDEPSGHGTWVFEAMEQGLIDPTRTIQIGIRSSAAAKARDYVQHRGGVIYTARELRGLDGQGLASRIASIKQRLGKAPTYMTFDIDCLDPAFAPGTGTPEPGGLSTSQALTFVEELHSLTLVGMDCVEVAPAYDHAELTSNAAAHLVWTYLCGRLARR